MIKLNKLNKHPLVQSIGLFTMLNFSSKAISFIVNPLFTYYIPPQDFAKLNILLNGIMFLTPFVYLGIYNTLTVSFINESKQNMAKILSTGLIVSHFFVLLIITGVIILRSIFFDFYKINYQYFILIPIFCLFNLYFDLTQVVLRFENYKKKIIFTNISKLFLEISIALTLIVFFNIGWVGRWWSIFSSTMILGVFSCYFLIKFFDINFHFDWKIVSKETYFWISSIINFFFIQSITIYDKFIANIFLEKAVLGNYYYASQFGFVILLFSTSITSAYFPYLFKQIKGGEPIVKKFSMIIGAIFIVTLMSILFVKVILSKFTHPSYSYSYEIYPMISIVYFFLALISILNGVLLYFKQSRILMYFGISALVFFLPIQYFGTKKIGLNGLVCSQIFFLTIILGIIFSIIYHNRKKWNLVF